MNIMHQNFESKHVHIVGAGISGLIAAINLEKMGFSPVIWEENDQIGGRVQTDFVEGYQLDRGFQVLLEAYPMAKKYLDFDALNLQPLDSGTLIFSNGQANFFGDPRRDISFLFPTIFSSFATLSDKFKIFQLNQKLNKDDVIEIFNREEHSTSSYLKKLGFSSKVIHSFFIPFFSGIFLEPDLNTSSRMFEFVYKMFSEGRAMIPRAGIGAISQQLKRRLQKTEIKLNTKVAHIKNNKIFLPGNESVTSDFIIVATNPENLINNYTSSLQWKSCNTIYLTTPKRSFYKPIIGLNAAKDRFANNIFYPTSIETEGKGREELLSVTVVKNHELPIDRLVEVVRQELKKDFNIDQSAYLKHYNIPHALPDLKDLQYERDEGESLLTENIAIAGDFQLNGSLNAAMTSGEKAALITKRVLSGNLIAV
ncbi:MAG: FAD-dependent oxidoreductase [Bacteroidota bacterium]